MSDEVTTIEVKDKEVRSLLKRLTRKLQDTDPLMSNIAALMASATESQFAGEKGPDGQAWPGLAEATKTEREKHGTWPGKMLQISSAGLAASIQTEHGNDYAQIGTNKVYGPIHFFGGEAGRGHKATIPARPYLPISAEGNLAETTKQDILKIMQNYLDSARF